MKKYIFLSYFCCSYAWALPSVATPIAEEPSFSPQIEIAGFGIGTIATENSSSHPDQTGSINFSDSSLLVGASQSLYNNAIGSFVFGVTSLEAANNANKTETNYFVNKTYVNYEAEKIEFLLGRTDNPNSHIIDFPVLRGDNLVTLLNPNNPLSDGKNMEEHRYSNVASFTFNHGLKYFTNLHLQHLINSALNSSDNGINSYGFTFHYLSSPGLENIETIPNWGFGFEKIHASGADINQASIGMVFNVNQSITDLVDLRLQNNTSWGSKLSDIATKNESYQADNNASTASIRYHHNPFGKAGYQVALTTSYQKFTKIADSSSWGTALVYTKELGQGFNFVTQYMAQWRSQKLAQVQTNGETFQNSVEIGLAFGFDAIFNKHLNPRRSLLNQQHQYIPN